MEKTPTNLANLIYLLHPLQYIKLEFLRGRVRDRLFAFSQNYSDYQVGVSQMGVKNG
jgi:hypothetical protein